MLQTDNELVEQYQNFLDNQRLSWTTHHHLTKLLGAGGQGKVYLHNAEGQTISLFRLPSRYFRRNAFPRRRILRKRCDAHADVAMRIAQIQHDNLLDVHNFVDRNRIRMLVMEWIDGLDLPNAA